MEQGKNQPIGLYRHRETGTYIGATDETQANAFVERGYELVKEAKDIREATEMSQEDNLPSDKETVTHGGYVELAETSDSKKGKK